jgi:DNA polymerase V
MFALVDCNNFFASCERVFNPKLEGQPIIILSNNDGCVIARSNEAKTLGIAMGIPFYQIKHLVQMNNIYVFSSNYSLYGHMSHRVMSILRDFISEIEEYSIDEAFLDLASLNNIDLEKYCMKIRAIIKRNTGIPVSIGIGKTKTLAKIANNIAKKNLETGVFQINNNNLDKILSTFPVKDIWGVGYKSTQKLNSFGIHSALQLRNANQRLFGQIFNLIGQKIIYELRGLSCIPLSESQPKKNILSSSSFSEYITNQPSLNEALSSHIVKACEKLRVQKSLCKGFIIFLRTNKFKLSEKQYSNNITYEFAEPTDDTRRIIKHALQSLTRIYEEGLSYHKIGIMLNNLIPKNKIQSSFEEYKKVKTGSLVMKAIDNINSKYGKNTIYFATQNINKNWSAKSEMQSRKIFNSNFRFLEVK